VECGGPSSGDRATARDQRPESRATGGRHTTCNTHQTGGDREVNRREEGERHITCYMADTTFKYRIELSSSNNYSSTIGQAVVEAHSKLNFLTLM
jgi:hypothetical protein